MYRSVRAIILAFLFLSPTLVDAQEETPQGNILARIYANYRQQINASDNFRGFDVTRAYFGYNYTYDSKISAQILLNVGSPLSTTIVTAKRYVFIKNALIQYRVNEKLTFSGGITEVKGSSVQNSYWDRKYLRHPFLLEHNFMNSADLGFLVDYNISDMVSIDLGVYNGEGYVNIQKDNILQYTAGLTISPLEGFTIRIYSDLYKGEDATKNTIAGFTGYRTKNYTIGLEYSYQTDSDMTDMHNKYGYCAFASVNITPKIDVFGRYDNVNSATLDGETEPWNISRDGSLIIGGIQYTYARYIKFSLNYQGWSSEDDTLERADFIQVNALFRF